MNEGKMVKNHESVFFKGLIMGIRSLVMENHDLITENTMDTR